MSYGAPWQIWTSRGVLAHAADDQAGAEQMLALLVPHYAERGESLVLVKRGRTTRRWRFVGRELAR